MFLLSLSRTHSQKHTLKFPRFVSLLFDKFLYIYLYSRPKQVKDVAHQDEVVRVLTNTLETANVFFHRFLSVIFFIQLQFLLTVVRVYRFIFYLYTFLHFYIVNAVPSYAILWTSWHRKNHHGARHFSSAFRVSS